MNSVVGGGDTGEVYDSEIEPNNVAIDQNTSETTTTSTILSSSDDTDEDGVLDDKDNCPEIPNGPEGGTCIYGDLGESCSHAGPNPMW